MFLRFAFFWLLIELNLLCYLLWRTLAVTTTIIQERVTFDSKEKSSFWELKQNRINEYVELMLRPHFGDLMSFVNECEPLIEQGHKQLLIRYSGKACLKHIFIN